MKRPKSHFTRFQKAFRYWQKEFGRNHISTTFRFEPIEGCYADIETNYMAGCANVRFSSVLHQGSSIKEAEETALHEALHLLVGRLKHLGKCRFMTEEELDEEEEAVVRTLEHVITELQNSAKKCSPRKG